MTSWVCARCPAMVTTDSRMPTIPTMIPTRRVLGSAACSGLTSISAIKKVFLFSFDDVQARIGPRDAEHAAANDLDDLAERGDIGDELADLGLGAGQFHDVARGIGRQHLAADAAQQRFDRLDMLREDLQFDQEQLS